MELRRLQTTRRKRTNTVAFGWHNDTDVKVGKADAVEILFHLSVHFIKRVGSVVEHHTNQ